MNERWKQAVAIGKLVDSVRDLDPLTRHRFRDAIEILLRSARESRRISALDCLGVSTGLDAWWPEGTYWPPGVPREWTMPGLVRALESLGWRCTESPKREPYQDRIVILALPAVAMPGEPAHSTPNHVLRQHHDGRWLSKLSFLEPLLFEWEELHEHFPLLRPEAILRRAMRPGRRCE